MQQLFFLFSATFLAAFLAALPPGLLNVNAAKTSVEKGKANGIMFGFGVSVTVMIQAYTSIRITKYLLRNSEIISLLLQIALLTFAILALFFFLKAKKHHGKPMKFVQSKKRGSFTKGVGLAAINILAIPYYSGLNTLFHKQNFMNYKVIDEVFFIAASGLGTFLVMYLYAFYFNKTERKANQLSNNSNYILSFLMVVLFIITSIRLFSQL